MRNSTFELGLTLGYLNPALNYSAVILDHMQLWDCFGMLQKYPLKHQIDWSRAASAFVSHTKKQEQKKASALTG